MHEAGPRTVSCLAALALSLAAPRAAAEFVDPLDRPAARSALAARRLLVGVTAAGDRLVAVGQRGHVVHSSDGGASWEQASVPVSTDLTAVHFSSAERGWAVGHGGVVLATADGGRTWTRTLDARELGPLLGRAYARGETRPPWLAAQLELLAGGDASFLDVWFSDERTGYAVGAFNLLLRTDDGGRSWTPWLDRSENPRGLHLHAIARVAGAVWIVGEQGLVLKLDGARQRFAAVRVPYEGSFFGVTGSDRTVIAYGLRGNAVRSEDGGDTWRKLDTGVDATLTGATRMADGRLVLVTQAGHVVVSADEGASFRPSPARAPAAASSVVATRGAGIVIVGAAGARVEPIE